MQRMPSEVSGKLDLRQALQAAVQGAAEGWRSQLREAPAPEPAPPEDPRANAEVRVALFQEQPILLIDEIPEAAPAEPAEGEFEEDRQALETALGLAPPTRALPSPPTPPAKAPPAPVAVLEAPPPRALAPVPAPHPLVARALSFLWTGLVRLLTILNQVVPPGLQPFKPMLGRVGIALTCIAAAGLVGFLILSACGR